MTRPPVGESDQMMSWKYLVRAGLIAGMIGLLSACGGGGANAPESDAAAPSSPVAMSPTPAVETTETETPAPSEPTSETPAQVPVTPTPPPALSKVVISGRITYDRVPFEGRSYRGLDYSKTTAMPARGVTVQLLNSNGSVAHSGQTDNQGFYSFAVAKEQDLRVRVVAELRGTGSAAWDIQVRDNTSGSAQYVLDGSIANVGSSNQTRNLHATSGWTGEGYTDPRSAAPFAVLDSLYDAVQTVVGADPTVVLPPLTVYWSANNIAINGNLSEGYIGTSFYTSAGPSIYLLGAANNDSDEYDRGVVQHEFGHYLEHQLGRTESIGGSHSQSSRLDMRVAFGEAWGNAFAGMVSGDPIYRDSLGASQSLGFAINVENRGFGSQGWYSEASVQAILYDLFDSQDDGTDATSLGFKPIYDVLTSDRYLDFDGFASIYAFTGELNRQRPDMAGTTAAMLASFDIYGSGWYGEGETNNAGSQVVLPLYHQVTLGETVNLCSDSDFQDYNGLDVRRYIRIQLPETRSYTILANHNATATNRNGGGLTKTNPQLRIFRQGAQVGSILNGTPNSENAQRYLNSGDYTFEIYEESNADGDDKNGGLACFDVRIQ